MPCVAVLKIQGGMENNREDLSLRLNCVYKRGLVMRHIGRKGKSNITFTFFIKVSICHASRFQETLVQV